MGLVTVYIVVCGFSSNQDTQIIGIFLLLSPSQLRRNVDVETQSLQVNSQTGKGSEQEVVTFGVITCAVYPEGMNHVMAAPRPPPPSLSWTHPGLLTGHMLQGKQKTSWANMNAQAEKKSKSAEGERERCGAYFVHTHSHTHTHRVDLNTWVSKNEQLLLLSSCFLH